MVWMKGGLMNMMREIDLDKEIPISEEEKEALLGHISDEDYFSISMSPKEVKDELKQAKKTLKTSHYNFKYKLTKADIEKGEIKLDPYFISQQWDLGSKDPSGVIFHCLKTIARFGTKNSVTREIEALKAQIQRLEELNNNVL